MVSRSLFSLREGWSFTSLFCKHQISAHHQRWSVCSHPVFNRSVMDQPGLQGAIQRFWQRSYAADYLGYVLLQVAYLGVCFSILSFVVTEPPETVLSRNIANSHKEQAAHNSLQALLYPIRSSHPLPICCPRTSHGCTEYHLCRTRPSRLLHSLRCPRSARFTQISRHYSRLPHQRYADQLHHRRNQECRG